MQPDTVPCIICSPTCFLITAKSIFFLQIKQSRRCFLDVDVDGLFDVNVAFLADPELEAVLCASNVTPTFK
ncbi:MAG: hypothetical protein MK200_08880 [Nitrosopumilus sp.]|nr:hypothetical protein [Nitrosopumilus sp.]